MENTNAGSVFHSFAALRRTLKTYKLNCFIFFHRNQSLHQDYKECATRFIALAPIGNIDKEKWVYACSLQPISKMRMTELLQSTTDETACPYDPNMLKQHQPGKVVTVSAGWLLIFVSTSLRLMLTGRCTFSTRTHSHGWYGNTLTASHT